MRIVVFVLHHPATKGRLCQMLGLVTDYSAVYYNRFFLLAGN